MSISESFTEDSIPRHAPRPSITFAETLATPTVPEVSLIFDRPPVQPEPAVQAQNSYKSYSAWKKETEKSPMLDSPSIGKKQVRFVPVSSSMQPQQMHVGVGFSTPPLMKAESFSQSTFGPRFSPGFMSSSIAAVQYSKPRPSPPSVNQCPDSVMSSDPRLDYMTSKGSNIPQMTHFQTPTTSQPHMPHVLNHMHHSPPTLNGDLHRSNSWETPKEEVVPAVVTKKEFDVLYELLQRQSSQIQMLQHHIELLLTQRTSTNNQNESPKPSAITAEKEIQCRIDEELDSTRRHSVGVNTSFEFNVQTNEDHQRRDSLIVSNRKFVLNCDEKENINLSFYGNVMGEVHGIRENAGCNPCKCTNGNTSSSIVEFAAVGAANIKERDKVFHQTAFTDEAPKQPINIAIKPCLQILPQPSTERSIAMNALALKYLPDEKLNQLVVPDMPKMSPSNGFDLSKPLNEMSLATMAYRNKYGLVNTIENERNYVENHQHLNCNDNNRLLDATAIRRQPKLM